MENSEFDIRVVFNNIPDVLGFKTSWGNSFIIKKPGLCFLFDTGDNGDILLYNLKKANIDPAKINAVAISHNHWDHTGGLWKILAADSWPLVFLPESFPNDFKEKVRRLGGRIENVKDFCELESRIYTTGEMEGRKFEQGLVIKTDKGPVLITGCAHPGIEKMAERCRSVIGVPYLIAGGFHLKDSSPDKIKEVANQLYKMGVQKVSPNHCSGEIAIKEFSLIWGKNFIKSGCGSVLEL
jgi:7,8-dihydropterin-6-yl-methyl-4-(beta-D-ribofuranosyl)aminobenzene 5'-phosphate synthase